MRPNCGRIKQVLHKLVSILTAANLALGGLAVMVAAAAPASADAGGNDYPYASQAKDGAISPFGFYYRECTDYVAYELNRQMGGTTGNIMFSEHIFGLVAGQGDAVNWKAQAITDHDAMNGTPGVGSVAWWGTSDWTGDSAGHIAIVTHIDYRTDGSVKDIVVDDYNGDNMGDYGSHTINASGSPGYLVWPDDFLHIADVSAPPPPLPTDTSSVDTLTGDFNGDGYADVALLHERTDGGADVHVLYGASTPFQNPTTYVLSLPGASGWNWSEMKLAVGDFNGDGYADVAIVHERTDGGADVHVLYGSVGTPFQNTSTYVLSLPGSANWNWSEMKLASGDFDGDGYSDLVILHETSDGGTDVHILYGSSGTPFQNSTTYVESLPASDGWDWSKMKLATGDFNGDGWDDIAIVHERSDDGADVHILYGDPRSEIFAYNDFIVSLPGSANWNWSEMKLVSGDFNGDGYDDLAILHERTDGGADIHMLYGDPGSAIFTYNDFIVSLPASVGWNWSEMRLTSGDFNGDGDGDLGILHQTTGSGVDVHALFGTYGGTPLQNTTTFMRDLPASDGWNWSLTDVA